MGIVYVTRERAGTLTENEPPEIPIVDWVLVLFVLLVRCGVAVAVVTPVFWRLKEVSILVFAALRATMASEQSAFSKAASLRLPSDVVAPTRTAPGRM